MKDKIKAIQERIKQLAKDDSEVPVRSFFTQFAELSNENYVQDMLAKILEKRPDVTGEHLAYLLYIALQYLTDFDYDKPVEKKKLEEDLKKHSDKIIELCQTKNISTNVIERYSLLQVIIGMLDKPVVVIDLGTSIGLGLMALNTDSFSHIDIDKEILPYVNQKAEIKEAIGIDMQSPDLKWQLACCFPDKKEDRPVLEKTYKKLQKEGTKIKFIQGSALELAKLDLPKADVIWTSNFFYEIEGDINKVIKDIKNLLNEKGIWIDADFRHSDKQFATQDNPYLAKVRRKEDWDAVLEVLESSIDWVRDLKPGKDFEKFKEILKKK
jgi:SAM-dependent methyltransferase